MNTRLLMISHAPTSALRTASFPADESLDLKGVDFTGMRETLANMGTFDLALIAPERRAIETAEELQLAIPFSTDTALRDCDYAKWTGRTLADIHAEEPDEIAAWLTDPASAPHGGESIVDLLKRVSEWMAAQSVTGKRMIAVTHPAVIRAAIVNTIGAPPHSFWRINIDPLGFADLRWHGGKWTLRALC